jgi:hypothetical protein
VVRQQRTVAGQKGDQIRHLLEVGRHVRIVAREVDVVELDLDDVLDRARHPR